MTWLTPCRGPAAAPVVTALVLGTCCAAGLEMTRTWLPGLKPCGGTTKCALLRTICVPAARGVDVLMTIFCWTVPVADAVTGVEAVVDDKRSPVELAGFVVAE